MGPKKTWMCANVVAAAVAALLLCGRSPAFGGDNPLFLSQPEKGPELLSAAEAGTLKKEAEALKRKAALLKEAAGKKYAASAELRKKAGGFRSEASKKGDALRSKADQNAAMSGFLGDMLGIMSGMGGMGGGLSSNAMFASQLTGTMVQGQKAVDAQGVATAQNQAGMLGAEAEKKAGPLEMRADELETDGNRLMEAHNRIMAIANAKSLHVAADELLRTVDADSRQIERMKESRREIVASMPAR